MWVKRHVHLICVKHRLLCESGVMYVTAARYHQWGKCTKTHKLKAICNCIQIFNTHHFAVRVSNFSVTKVLLVLDGKSRSPESEVFAYGYTFMWLRFMLKLIVYFIPTVQVEQWCHFGDSRSSATRMLHSSTDTQADGLKGHCCQNSELVRRRETGARVEARASQQFV